MAQLDNQYNSIISKADKFFNDALYNEAKNEYQQALKIKSNEQYPNDQLIAIAAKLKIEDNKIQQEENKRKFDEPQKRMMLFIKKNGKILKNLLSIPHHFAQ